MTKLTHVTETGDAHMVDISAKDITDRVAVATGRIRMQPDTVDTIRAGQTEKGNVLGVAQVAGIMAAKNTSQMIPMCHPLMLTGIDVTFTLSDTTVDITATVKTSGKTGVEMEALTAVSVAALTVYDMVKAIDRGMVIESIQLESKTGGASGQWQRTNDSELLCSDDSCAIGTPLSSGVNLQALSMIGIPKSPTGSGEPNRES